MKNRVVVHVHKLSPSHSHAEQGVREKERAVQITMDRRWTYDLVTGIIGRVVGREADSRRPCCLR